MARAFTLIRQWLRKDEGQDLLEYGLLAVLIAIAALAGVTAVADKITGVLWEAIAQNL
jgi:Flp pilus assembly pilin Flp